jgi:hypothetical protein
MVFLGSFIGGKLCEVIEEYGASKICAVVTDNASNMKAAWKHVQNVYPHIFCVGCVAHGLHLLCKDFLKKVPFFESICSKCERVVSYFWNHNIPRHELEEQQQKRYGKVISLKKYSPIRWGTVHEMFKCLLDSKEAFLAIAG